MATILRDCPFLGRSSDLLLPAGNPLQDARGRTMRAGENQLVLWVSFVPEGQPAHPSLPRFPVVIDSGFGDTLVVQQQEIEHLLGIRYQLLERSRDANGRPLNVRVRTGPILPKDRVNLLAHANLPGFRDRPDPTAVPVLLRFTTGIIVWPTLIAGGGRIRLPLLGMLGLHEVGATVVVDGPRGVAQMSI